MPAPAYTESEAALHELGHTIVACALGLPFQHVEIRPANAPRTGWEGQCLLVNAPRRAEQDAFQLGGPLLQLLMEPQSLGAHAALFQPSLFTHHLRLMDKKDLVPVVGTDLGWADLYITGMVHQVTGWPGFMMNNKGFGGARPWVVDLEGHVRTFLALPLVQEFATETRPKLVQALKLNPQPVLAAFKAKVPANSYAALVAFLAAQPN